jgi:DNA-directed RNA polymerase specialized sigma24 family protein
MAALRHFDWETDTAFRGFIKVTTANVVLDQIRKDRSGKRDKSREISLDPAMPIAVRSDAVDADYKILLQQIARCLEKHTDPYGERTRDIAIFLLYFGHGHKVTAMELSKVYKLNVRLVENIIAKLTRVARSKCLGRAAAKS